MKAQIKRSYTTPMFYVYGDLATITFGPNQEKAMDAKAGKTFGISFEDSSQGDFAPSGSDSGRGGRQ